VLEAWQNVFGTMQLTHAKDRLDAAEKEVEQLRRSAKAETEAVRVAITALEYHAAAYHRKYEGENDDIMVEWHVCNECLEKVLGPSPVGLVHDKDCTTANALAALKQSTQSKERG
jgi:hypothetical protein